MRKLITCGLIVLFCTSITGCATIMTGTTQKIPVSSNPSGANLQVDGQSTYTTPVTVVLERKRDHILVFTKEGYNQATITILHVLSGAVCGNILLGGLIGFGVDACTGAMNKLVPENVQVELQKAAPGASAPVAIKELTPEDKINQLKNMYDKGMLTKEEYEANKKVILYQMSQQGVLEAQGAAVTQNKQENISTQAPQGDLGTK